MTIKLTAITPCLNPRMEYIRRVFNGLQNQTLALEKWEYLVVDSGNTPPLEEQFDLSWHPHARVIHAPGQRLAYSRLLGLEHARGEIIVFVDDDNVLAPDYFDAAILEMDRYAFIGSLGGYVEAEFHGEIQPWMHDFLPILGASQFLPVPPKALCYGCPVGPWMPSGSGMMIRRVVAEEYRRQVTEDPARLAIGRVGNSLMGSDDIDLACTANDLNMAVGRSTRPRLTHLIPASRLTERYLERLLYASNYATASLYVRKGWRKQTPRPPVSLRSKIGACLATIRKAAPEARCWRAFRKGYQDGLAGAPFDPRYQ